MSTFIPIGPLAYQGKAGCQSALCRSEPDVAGGWRCVGYHCAYCDEPCSSQGHRCDVADAILGEARRAARAILPPAADNGTDDAGAGDGSRPAAGDGR